MIGTGSELSETGNLGTAIVDRRIVNVQLKEMYAAKHFLRSPSEPTPSYPIVPDVNVTLEMVTRRPRIDGYGPP